MARIVLGKLALLFSVLGIAGCHCCRNDCQVTGYCVPEVKKEKVVEEGWDVECKQICIPPVHCPFSNSCEPKCGKVIAVRKLVPDEIECGEECLLSYKLVDPCAQKEEDEKDAKKEEKAKKPPKPVEAPKPTEAPPMEKAMPPSELEAPNTTPPSVEAAAMTPRSAWADRRAEFQASYEEFTSE